MATGNRLLILTEAGDGIGYGHYSRCLAIKQFFEFEGTPTDIILNIKGSQVEHFLNVLPLNWIPVITDLNAQKKYSHVLLDSYLAPLSIVETLKQYFNKVIVIDDFHRIDNGPHLIINPNIYGDVLPYRSPHVGGRKFVILRESFRKENGKIKVKQEIKRILITLGGSDIHILIPNIVRILLKAELNSEIHVVAGSEAYAGTLKKEYEFPDVSVRIHGFVNEGEMKNLMLQSDLAISACGQTLHELTWLGVPVIGICIGDDQILNMKEYIRLGVLQQELLWNDPNLDYELMKLIQQVKTFQERKRRSDNAVAILHNKGLNHIYNEIFK